MGSKERRAEEQLDYQSYLLRLWRVNSEDDGWQASLESAHAGRRRGFADLEALFSFLRRQTSRRPNACLEEGESGRNKEEKEGRWSSGSAYRRSAQRKHHWFKIHKSIKERKR